MAVLNSSEAKELKVSSSIKEDGKQIDNKFIASISMSGNVITYKDAMGNTLGTTTIG